jgi:toluene monooxygenase system protein A
MALLKREQWYDLGRDTSWTPSYVAETELFPEALSGALGLPAEAWERWAEPPETTFREHVETQREKDPGAHPASQGARSFLAAHFGAFAIADYQAAIAQARIARFSRAPGDRNQALLGILDEIRHGQLQLFLAHELGPRDRPLDWVGKALQSEAWVATAIRHLFDDTRMTRSATETAVMLTVGFASDLANPGETSPSRPARRGAATVRVLVENGKKAEAQRVIDIAFWRSWRAFCLVTGPAMDYYTPLADRTRSFQELVQERIAEPFVRAVEELGLARPWYWDHFLASAESYQHSLHLAVWYWRQTVWWNPRAGVTPEERDWLEQKYPGWNDTFGRCWDAIIENGLTGQQDRLSPTTLPVVCNMCCIPIVGTPGAGWAGPEAPQTYSLDHLNRRYSFCSEECRWIFEVDSDRYQGHFGLIDRVLRGQVPPGIEGALDYMGIGPGERGEDAEAYRWIETYRG